MKKLPRGNRLVLKRVLTGDELFDAVNAYLLNKYGSNHRLSKAIKDVKHPLMTVVEMRIPDNSTRLSDMQAIVEVFATPSSDERLDKIGGAMDKMGDSLDNIGGMLDDSKDKFEKPDDEKPT